MKVTSKRRLKALETLYLELLVAALQRCAKGQWGLLGQNDAVIGQQGRPFQARLRDPAVNELLDLGSEIERLRRKLGHVEAFPLHERLVQMRSSHDPNAPGEPQLAQLWLDELLGPESAIA